MIPATIAAASATGRATAPPPPSAAATTACTLSDSSAALLQLQFGGQLFPNITLMTSRTIAQEATAAMHRCWDGCVRTGEVSDLA